MLLSQSLVSCSYVLPSHSCNKNPHLILYRIFSFYISYCCLLIATIIILSYFSSILPYIVSHVFLYVISFNPIFYHCSSFLHPTLLLTLISAPTSLTSCPNFRPLLLCVRSYHIITVYMELSPSWEAASCAATKEFYNIIYGTLRFITVFTTVLQW
jgi:hypothetical protein